MASIIDICNIALTNLGEQKIVSLQENNERARLCNLRFPDVRDTILSLHPWNCVTKRSVLVRLADAPAWGFTYQYQLPNDCLRVLSLSEPTITYRIEGRVLLTDETSIKLKYIYRPEDLSVLDASIITLLGLRMSWELSEPLTAKTQLKNEMYSKFSIELASARSMDATEGTVEYYSGSTWLDSRQSSNVSPWRPIDAPAEGYPKSS